MYFPILLEDKDNPLFGLEISCKEEIYPSEIEKLFKEKGLLTKKEELIDAIPDVDVLGSGSRGSMGFILPRYLVYARYIDDLKEGTVKFYKFEIEECDE